MSHRRAVSFYRSFAPTLTVHHRHGRSSGSRLKRRPPPDFADFHHGVLFLYRPKYTPLELKCRASNLGRHLVDKFVAVAPGGK